MQAGEGIRVPHDFVIGDVISKPALLAPFLVVWLRIRCLSSWLPGGGYQTPDGNMTSIQDHCISEPALLMCIFATQYFHDYTLTVLPASHLYLHMFTSDCCASELSPEVCKVLCLEQNFRTKLTLEQLMAYDRIILQGGNHLSCPLLSSCKPYLQLFNRLSEMQLSTKMWPPLADELLWNAKERFFNQVLVPWSGVTEHVLPTEVIKFDNVASVASAINAAIPRLADLSAQRGLSVTPGENQMPSGMAALVSSAHSAPAHCAPLGKYVLKSTEGFAEIGLLFGSDAQQLAEKAASVHDVLGGYGFLLQPYSPHLRSKEYRVFLRPRSHLIWTVVVTTMLGAEMATWILDDMVGGDAEVSYLQSFVNKLASDIPAMKERIAVSYQTRIDCFIDPNRRVILNEVTTGLDCAPFAELRHPRLTCECAAWMYECLSRCTILALGMVFVNESTLAGIKEEADSAPRRDALRLSSLQKLYPDATVVSLNKDRSAEECEPHLHYMGTWTRASAKGLRNDARIGPHLSRGCRFILCDYIRMKTAYAHVYDSFFKDGFLAYVEENIILPHFTEVFVETYEGLEKTLQEVRELLKPRHLNILWSTLSGASNPLFRATADVDKHQHFHSSHDRNARFARIVTVRHDTHDQWT